MATVTTKYSIGDVVYRAGTVITRKQHSCPDCLGSRKWKATSPAGRDYEFDCPRCAGRYQSNRDLSLDYSAHVPAVERLTIGSVRFDSERTDRQTEYMCCETGIGSGALYDERDLFETKEEAQAVAEIMAKERDQSSDWIGPLFDKTLELSDYQIGDAALKAARDMDIRRRVDIQTLFDDLREAEAIEDVRETIEKFQFRD